MVDLPPGIIYTIRKLPSLLLPPAAVYALRVAAQVYLGVRIPTWLFISAATLSFPAYVTVRVLSHDYKNQRDAAAAGAVLAPCLSKSFAGLDVLRTAVTELEDSFPGDIYAKRCGEVGHTYNMRMLFQDRIFTAEPEYIKAILATQFDDFEKGEELSGALRSLLGTGVFNSDGDMWRFHRGMTRPFFSKERISDFENFDRHAEAVITRVKARLEEGYPVDIQEMAARYTLDSSTEFLYGSDVRSLASHLPYPHYSPQSQVTSALDPAAVFSKAVLEAQVVCAKRLRLGGDWPLTEFWRDEVKEHMSVIQGFIRPILSAAVQKKRAAKGAEDVKGQAAGVDAEVQEGETMLDHLVNYTEDETILMDEILNLLIAARDSTTATLAFTMYMLAEHPHVLKRLREEILQNVGSSKAPTIEDFRDMKYLRAVINETLRLYPPIAFNMRRSNKATVWPSKIPGRKPFFIPANTTIPYSVLVMQRRKDLWGPDAENFDPDRFIDERLHKYLTPNPSIFLPFNGGPRICLGQQFAYHEASFFIVRVLQNFSDISLASHAQPPASHPPLKWAAEGGGLKASTKVWPKTHFTMYVSGGLWVDLKEANPAEAEIL